MNEQEKRRTRTGDASSGTAPARSAARSEDTAAQREPLLALPTLSPPEGGGAIRGIDAKFRMNPATGTASLQIPIATTPGRGGLDVSLSLSYDSGSGNGPFGVGWQLSAPAITRKADKRLARYDIDDLFMVSGGEDLVATPGERHRDGFTIRRYQPRVEDSFTRVERWTDDATGDVHWRTTSPGNVTSIFGRSHHARIVDPHDQRRVYSWLLEETRDDRGSVIRYGYKAEDGARVDPREASETHRFDGSRFLTTAQRYLKRVHYGNRRPGQAAEWLFEIVLDYGEHANESKETRTWDLRPDPFSTYRSGFEVRTNRLCRRVMVFHQFEELGEQPVLVRSTNFEYDPQPHLTRLVRATQVGHDGDRSDTLPPVDLHYTPRTLDGAIRKFDRRSLDGIPSGVDGIVAQWVDLDGEGIPGVLVENERGWFYKKNLGDGQLAPPSLLRSLPSPAAMRTGVQQLADIDGDGRLELVSYMRPLPGYFARTEDGGWEPFVPFEDVPNLDWRGREIRFVDLDGDGRSDLLLTEDDAFVWYASRGEEGFEPPRFATRAKDENSGPAVVFSNGEEAILLADMSGDGLVDLVRVRNGEICYWPNLGYGGFGRKVTMSNVPRFDAEHRFSSTRVRLSDIDGSGTSDILYLGTKGVRVFFNESGNRLSDGATLDLPIPHSLATVSVVDILGRGTACIVWSSTAPADLPRPILYVDLMGGRKPHLLERFANNLGGETTLLYESSTQGYLRDARMQQPWITRLPFPVHVVARVEQHDRIAKTKLVTRYHYHHGFYDGVEREYRGFASVEQWDAETFSGPHELVRPPVRTRMWFHTGASVDREQLEDKLAREFYRGDPDAVPHPPITLPAQLNDEERRQAARALRGRMLRQEIYADDATPESAHPYSVSETNYAIRLLRHADGERRAVFHIHITEQVDRAYERNSRDPRVGRRLVLAIDDFGNVTRERLVAHPRRQPLEPEQEREWVTETESVFANLTSDDIWRLGVPLETRISELGGGAAEIAPQATGMPKAWPTSAGRAGLAGGIPRLLSRTQHSYVHDDLALALPLEVRKQVFTPELLRDVHGDDIDASLLEEGGYRFLDGAWWAPSNQMEYDAAAFYQPIAAVDPFGNRSVVRYDRYALKVVETEDALRNTTRAELDYRVLAPALLTDANGNRTASGFDVFGMPVRTAIMGKGEGDTLDDPTTIVEYDMHRFERAGLPLVVRSLARERHGPSNPRWQESYTYVDGSGREIMRKMEAEPGPSGGRRWVGTGRTIFDNKGNAVRRYEPYFSATHEYEDEAAIVETGVTPVMQYDPLGRLVRTDLPNGGVQKIEVGPWAKTTFDENDTVLESAWYRDRGSPDPRGPQPSDARLRAAWLAAKHAGTPGREHFDALGRGFLGEEDNGDPRGTYKLRREFDILGNTLSVTDARGIRTIHGQRFDMLQRVMATESADSGRVRTFADVGGNPLRSWTARGQVLTYRYDELRRTSQVSAGDTVISSIEYGESDPDAVEKNLRTRAHRTWDSAGLLVNERYDFRGKPVHTTRRLARDHRRSPDWSKDGQEALERETFSASTTFDAIGRVISAIAPDGSETRPTYNEANLLEGLETRLRGGDVWTTTIANIDYDARGQRTRVVSGNGVVTTYEYEHETFRLLRQVSIRGDGVRLQDDRFEYDPIGNIVAIADDVSFGYEKVRGDAAYEYDPLYQLVLATGREHPGRASGPDDVPGVDVAHPHDLQRLRRYRERYAYDPTGNILEVKHEPLEASDAGYRRLYHYDPNSSRLLRTTGANSDETVESFTYDAAGNTTSMTHLRELRWDHADRLQYATRGGGGEVTFTYDGGGARMRKVRDRDGFTEERLYLGAFELYRRRRGEEILFERATLHLFDGSRRIALAETKTVDEDATSVSNETRLRYSIENQLGSSVFELDEAGDVISYEQYLPFGESSFRAYGPALDADRKRYRYTGKERDEETGLDYYGARYYAAWLGRWTSVDPSLRTGAGTERLDQPYVYVRNRPIIANDPDGRVIWFLVAAIVIVGTATAISPANAPTSAEEAAHAQPAISDSEFLVHMTVTGVSFAAGGGTTTAIARGTGSKFLAGLGGGAISGFGAPADLLVHDAFRGELSSGSTYGERTAWGVGGGAFLGGLFGVGSRVISGPAPPPVNGGWFGRTAPVATTVDDALTAELSQGGRNSVREILEGAGVKVEPYAPSGPVYGQGGRFTCVGASCRMVAGDAGVTLTEQEAISALESVTPGANVANEGISVLRAAPALEQVGVKGGVPLATATQAELEAALTQGRSAILGIRIPGMPPHAVVADEISGGMISVRDPLPVGQGSSFSVRVKDLLDFWQGRMVKFE